VSATLTVTNTNDAGPGSLRQAIADAADGDLIQFDPAIAGQTIFLTSGELPISGKNLTIEGSATQGITISGSNISRVFAVVSGLTLTNATITGGNSGGQDGGGIINVGTLQISHSTLSGNQAASRFGGAIANFGTLTITNSTISGNQSETGGGIINAGQTTLISTTVTGNSAGTGGGISGNVALRNSIVAANAASLNANCNGVVTLSGINLSDDASCGFTGPSMITGDPRLGPLVDNGGPTWTHNLLNDSPAIDAALGCSVTDDQRYITRPQGAACDIGAVEFNDYVNVSLTVDASQSVNPNTGVAVVTGTMTCSAPVSIPLDVKLSQVQKRSRVTSTVSASAQTTVDCTGMKFWAVSMAPPSGAFVNTDASVSATSLNTDKWVTPASITTPVKLYWSHR
jgi:hypothetical protein